MLSFRIFATKLILCKQNCQLIFHYFRIFPCCSPNSFRLFLNYPLLKLFQLERHINTYINVMVKISVAPYCNWRGVCVDWLGHQLSWQIGIVSYLAVQVQLLGHNFFLPNGIQFIIH